MCGLFQAVCSRLLFVLYFLVFARRRRSTLAHLTDALPRAPQWGSMRHREDLHVLQWRVHYIHLLATLRDAIHNDMLTAELRILPLPTPLLHAPRHLLVAPGLTDMGDACVSLLPQLAVAHNLRHLNAQRVVLDVVDCVAGAAMVAGKWHALLHRVVHDNVDRLAALGGRRVPRHNVPMVWYFLGNLFRVPLRERV